MAENSVETILAEPIEAITPEPVKIVERVEPPKTLIEKISRNFASFLTAFLRTAALSVFLLPLLLLSFMTVDLPFRPLDRFAPADALKPSLWLSWGGFAMAFAPLLVILFARRFGGDEASRVVTAAWGVAAISALAGILHWSPGLGAGDYPPVRFVAIFVGAAMAGQFVAASVYDVTRGGGPWWRAPLYSAMIGYAVSGLIYFPLLFRSVGAPWGSWLILDIAVKFLVLLSFLPLYHVLRDVLKPRGGFGGI
ncbi:MAG: hypothetical protein AAF850_04405 [Pseudomonadota bacterium]